jgi:hypothetical protein
MALPVIDHGTGPSERFIRARRERLVLPLGGVDRDSGVYTVGRGATRDLRNVIMRDGTVHLRSGFLGSTVFPDHMDVLAMEYLPYEDVLITVVANTWSGEVNVFRVRGTGSDVDPQLIGLWFTYDTEGEPPPITMAETYQRVFMAAYQLRGDRPPTFVYDPQGRVGSGGFLGPLEADWAQGDNLIRFRGVVAYLDYLVGWGFGTNGDDRPDLVRISLPGEPLRINTGRAGFELSHWVAAGARGTPVVACAPAGQGLLILKQHETYPLLGTSPRNFGVGPAVDQRFGCAGPKLTANLNGVLYIWTSEGPRATTGGPLEDLALPLDLDGPTPDTLAEVTASGFATYVPGDRVVLFVFGNWVYALDVRRGGPGGWSYWVSGKTLASAGFGYPPSEGFAFGNPPVAGPYYDDIILTGTNHLDMAVRNEGNDGNELIETWYRVHLSGNSFVQSPLATVPALQGITQTIRLSGLNPDTTYDIAFRYNRSGLFHPDYPTASPESWPAGSRATLKTGVSAAATAGWSRVSLTEEQVLLQWEVPAGEHPSTERVIEKHTLMAQEDDFNDIPPGDWDFIATVSGGVSQYAYEVPPAEAETWVIFRVRLAAATIGSAKAVWIGPRVPAWLSRPNPPNGNFVVDWDDGASYLTGRPYLWIVESTDQENNRIFSAEVFMYPVQNAGMGGEFEWRRYVPGSWTPEEGWPNWTPELHDRLPWSRWGLSGLVYEQLHGVTDEHGESTGDIRHNREYAVRGRAVQVFGAASTLAEYNANPTGSVLDYSPWTMLTNRWLVP